MDRQRLEPSTRTAVADILDAYLEQYATPNGELGNVKHLHRAPKLAFGKRDPLTITQADIDEYVHRRCRGEFAPDIYADGRPKPPRKLQPQSVAREISAMQAALNWGSRRLMVFGKPTFRFERPHDKEVRVVWLTEVQEEDLRSKLHRASRSLQLFIIMGLTYGVRRGAMRDLQFGPQVSFVSNSIDFNVPGKRRTKEAPGGRAYDAGGTAPP